MLKRWKYKIKFSLNKCKPIKEKGRVLNIKRERPVTTQKEG
jgi:hypothetical protein